MIVSDTHTLVWWVADDPRLSARARDAMDTDELVIVPAIVLWEIAMLAVRGQVTLGSGTTEYLERAVRLPRLRLEPLSPRIAVRANSFGDAFHRDPADRLIVATAIELGVPLVTKDERMHAFGGVQAVW